MESARSGEPLDLARFALDQLDVGVAVITPTLEVKLANPVARQAFAAFGEPESSPRLPDALREVVRKLLEKTGPQFSAAVPTTAPDGRRYFLRARVSAAAIVLTIAAAALREVDIKRTLSAEYGLSAQEIRVAYLAARGFRNKEIARELKIVEGTVKNYLTNIFNALAVRSRTELTAELHQLIEEQTDVHLRGA